MSRTVVTGKPQEIGRHFSPLEVRRDGLVWAGTIVGRYHAMRPVRTPHGGEIATLTACFTGNPARQAPWEARRAGFAIRCRPV